MSALTNDRLRCVVLESVTQSPRYDQMDKFFARPPPPIRPPAIMLRSLLKFNSFPPPFKAHGNTMDWVDSSVSVPTSKSNQPFRKSKPRAVATSTYCALCKSNNETGDFYRSHVLYDPFGKVLCPILRKYNCPLCNSGGGDDAHTLGHCPLRKEQNLCPPTLNNELTATGRPISRRRLN